MIRRISLGLLWCGCALSTALAAQKDATSPVLDPGAPVQADSKAYDLRYRLKAGEVLRTKVRHQATVEMTVAGNTQTTKTDSESVKVWRITAVDSSGNITLVNSVESVDMRQQASDRAEVTYNSQTDKQPPPDYKEVAQSIGVPLAEITIDARGQTLRREDKRPPPAMGQNNQVTVPLPAEEVRLGQTWALPQDVTVKLKDGTPKQIKIRQQFSLESVQSGVATIRVESQRLTPVNDPQIEAPQLIEYLPHGSVRFDIDAGRVLSQQMDIDNRAIGFSGNNSSIHYLTRFTEELQPAPATAARPAPEPLKTKRK